MQVRKTAVIIAMDSFELVKAASSAPVISWVAKGPPELQFKSLQEGYIWDSIGE